MLPWNRFQTTKDTSFPLWRWKVWKQGAVISRFRILIFTKQKHNNARAKKKQPTENSNYIISGFSSLCFWFRVFALQKLIGDNVILRLPAYHEEHFNLFVPHCWSFMMPNEKDTNWKLTFIYNVMTFVFCLEVKWAT